MSAPLAMSFDVACSVRARVRHLDLRDRHRGGRRDHTVTGQADVIVLQGEVGGRIFERTADGAEHDWGEVTVWQPPTQLAYLWHLGRDRADATEVEIRFLARGAGRHPDRDRAPGLGAARVGRGGVA